MSENGLARLNQTISAPHHEPTPKVVVMCQSHQRWWLCDTSAPNVVVLRHLLDAQLDWVRGRVWA